MGIIEIKEKLRQDMINLIISEGLPVGYRRAEADSYWTIIVNKDKTLTGGGYAEDGFDAINNLENLPILELGNLIDGGKRGKELRGIEEGEGGKKKND